MYAIEHPEQDLPLFGAASTRRIEQRHTLALPPHTLMRRAGRAVARLALALAPHARCIWVAAGPGNNGGDGIEAATLLHLHGRTVRVTLCGDPQHLPKDAHEALGRAQAAGVPLQPQGCPPLDSEDLAIDALLGIGATREPDGSIAALIAHLNALPCSVLAVDVPTGLHVDTGQPIGQSCVVARHTLSLLTLKPGLFTGMGRDHAGAVWFEPLDAALRPEADDPPDAWLTGTQTALASVPTRRHAQHKGSFGDVAIVGGATGMTGAAVLAARAAHAAGAGRVFVQILDEAMPAHDPQRPELMFRSDWVNGPGHVVDAATVACGCGGADAVRVTLPRLLGRACRLVLDADALNAIAADAQLQTLLSARAAAGRPTVITPHPLEAARLLTATSVQVQADRLAAAQALARRFGCVVLLKGSGSVIAAPDRPPMVNPTGNASLAGAGTGDVLAGWLAGMWAQCRDEEAHRSGFSSAAAAAFLHGAAADPSGQISVRANDLIERIQAVWANGHFLPRRTPGPG